MTAPALHGEREIAPCLDGSHRASLVPVPELHETLRAMKDGSIRVVMKCLGS